MKSTSIKRKIFFLINKYFWSILVALVIVFLLGGYLMFIKDTLAEITKIGMVDLKSKEAQLSGKDLTLSRLSDLQEQFNEISENQKAQLDRVLPSQADIPYLVIDIKNFIADNDLILTNLDVGPLNARPAEPDAKNVRSKSVSELKISLGVSGLSDYGSLKKFLDKMSNALPLLELTSLTYASGTESYGFNLTTYYQ